MYVNLAFTIFAPELLLSLFIFETHLPWENLQVHFFRRSMKKQKTISLPIGK